MQQNSSIAFYFYLNRLCDATTAQALHSNYAYGPVGMTTLIVLQGHTAYKTLLYMT